jgi:probable rRNA maturation factor
MEASILVEPPARAILRSRNVSQRSLAGFAATLQDRVTKGRAFHCRFTGDAELRRLNRTYLRHDYATDVLSFPAIAALPDRFAGDLAISVDRAAAQAREFGHSLKNELCILMLHGCLHLAGLDHETDSGTMQRAERRWRKAFGLPDGLIERVGRLR